MLAAANLCRLYGEAKRHVGIVWQQLNERVEAGDCICRFTILQLGDSTADFAGDAGLPDLLESVN